MSPVCQGLQLLGNAALRRRDRCHGRCGLPEVGELVGERGGQLGELGCEFGRQPGLHLGGDPRSDLGVLLGHLGVTIDDVAGGLRRLCLLYTSPSPRDRTRSRMPSSA